MNDPNGSGATQSNVTQQLWDCYVTNNERYHNEGYSGGSQGPLFIGGQETNCLSSLGNSGNDAPLDSFTCNGSNNQSWYSNEAIGTGL